MAETAEKDKKTGTGAIAAVKGEASKEKGKTGNMRHSGGVLLSTGGGTPIEGGKKWTYEHRVLQPRDKTNGQFTYNSEAHWGLKYEQRNHANTVPPSAREYILNSGLLKRGGIKAGDVIVWNGKTQIALRDMPVSELVDYFKKYDQRSGEYYIGHATEESGPKTDNRKFGSEFVAKQGRKSKAERETIEKSEGSFNGGSLTPVGHYDLSKVSAKTAGAIAKKVEEKAQGFFPGGWDIPLAHIDPLKRAVNETHNAKVDAEREAEASQPRKPAVTGPYQPSKPNYPEGYKPDFEADVKMDAPKGLFSKGKLDQSKVDYDGSVVQRRFFDKLAKHFAGKASEMGIPEDAAKLLASKKGGRFIAKKMKTSKSWGSRKYQWGF